MKNLSLRLLLVVAMSGLFAIDIAVDGLDRDAVYAQHDDEHGDEHGTDEGEHEGEEHGDEIVALSAHDLEEFGVTVDTVGAGNLYIEVTLPGEVRFNEDRLAHVVPRLSGFVLAVHKTLGDEAKTGDIMAVLDSRELANAKAGYLAAVERETLAQALLAREEDLRKKKLSAEQDYLAAKQARAEAGIDVRVAENELHALGFSEEYVQDLPNQPDASLTRYEIVAPFDGTVVEKHVVLGEALKDDTEIFVIADLTSVWVDLSVYQKDVSIIRKGQRVTISTSNGLAESTGEISYMGATVGESTRTALARVVVANTWGDWRPGTFVTAQVATEEFEVRVKVPHAALQTVEGRLSVFVETPEGFVARPVATGRTDATHAEVTSGLAPGERIATAGTLLLKAELGKASFGGGHGH